jgi:hypothetical protein
MTGAAPGRQATEQLLITLRGELASRGVNSGLQDDGGQPSLGVYYPSEGTGASDLFDSVIVTRFRGEWWYGWPEVVPICAVTPVGRAAQTIISELTLGDTSQAGDAVITDLDVWRKLRQAAQDVFRPNTPGPAPAGLAPGPARPPDSTCPPAVIADSTPAARGLDRAGDRLAGVAAELAIAGFQVNVVDRWSDGRPSVLAVTSPVTGARAEVTAHGTELELRCWGGPPGDAHGRITAQVTAVLSAGGGEGGAAGTPAVTAAEDVTASPGERRALLAHLRDRLAGLGVRASPQPGGQSLEIWFGLYAGVSQDGTRYGWTTGGGVRTHPADDPDGAARRIAARRDMLTGGGDDG